MWPFDRGGPVLLLYVTTLALHAVFVGYANLSHRLQYTTANMGGATTSAKPSWRAAW